MKKKTPYVYIYYKHNKNDYKYFSISFFVQQAFIFLNQNKKYNKLHIPIIGKCDNFSTCYY